jgi:methylated-DNA-[protein]-cysteine S-methyltransferase
MTLLRYKSFLMANPTKYTIFKTNWGYFGLVTNKKGLLRTCLPAPARLWRGPCPGRKIIERRLLVGLDNPQFEKNLLKPLQAQIIAYFEGRPAKLDAPLALNRLSPFTQKVLAACRKIPPGKTVSYSQLAGMIGKPRASRAVGSALAKNPIPLIIPCHRIIHSDSSLGNFSAFGGTSTKKKLLALES